MEISLEVDMKEVLDNFDRLLNSRQRGRVVANAKRAAGNVIRKAAAAEAPIGPDRVWRGRSIKGGALKRSLSRAKTGLKVTRNKNVYVIAGRPTLDEDAFYARFVEFGTGPPGPTDPNPFMARAAKSAKDEAMAAFEKKFIEGVFKQILKKPKRGR